MVTVVRGWGTESRPVTVGENDGFQLEILSGLKEGERVSLAPPPPGAGSSR
jgi:multidrug efflux pump subunit AcrA (membrane-fusion protein)